MLTEIVVATIGAAGTLGVAYLARGGGPGQDRRIRRVSLITLSEYCGYARGVAAAAVEDCAKSIRLTKREGGSVGWKAQETYELFTIHVWLRTEPPPSADSEFEAFKAKVNDFGTRLQSLCEAIDHAADRARDGQDVGGALKELRRRDLRTLEEELRNLDRSFAEYRQGWFAKYGPGMAPRAGRLIWRRARSQYDIFAQKGRRSSFTHPRAQTAASSGGDFHLGTTTPHRSAEPPCGNCVWLCPHVPDGLGNRREGASHQLTGPSSGSAGGQGHAHQSNPASGRLPSRQRIGQLPPGAE